MIDKWFPCEIVDKYTKDTWFSGKEYYIVMKINNQYIKEKEVVQEVYYRDNKTMTLVHMYSEDGRFWTFEP